MKRILHISKFYYPYVGGIENVVKAIVDTFTTEYEQMVLCFQPDGHYHEDVQNGVTVMRVGTFGTFCSQPVTYNFLYHVWRVIRDFRPDIIHLHLPNPLVCGLLLLVPWHNAKVVVHWHADILNHNRLIYALCKPIEQAILKRANRIIVTSLEYAESSIPLAHFQGKIDILPNTVNVNKFLPPPIDHIESIRAQYSDRPIIFAMGRHVEYKGLEYLIRAVPLLSLPVAVVIGGEGLCTNRLRALAAGTPSIHFVGSLSDEQLNDYFHAADIFVFPSIDRREAFGVALAEALYCGVPAVTFNIKGSGVIWVNQNQRTGIVVDTFSPQALADAIAQLLQDKDRRLEMGKQARKWVQEHFLPNQIEKLREIYSSVYA